MPSLKAIRNRIRSVKNIQQITRAMKMVSAAKLRRAQQAVLAARPYSRVMKDLLDAVARRTDLPAHPLLQRRELKRVELLVLTSDRGLCGGFNANVFRRVQRFLLENEDRFERVTLRTLGRKGSDFFRRRPVTVTQDYGRILPRMRFAEAQAIALDLSERFLSGEIDGVYLVHNEFVSAVSQRVEVVGLLPIEAPAPRVEERLPVFQAVDFIYEPDEAKVLAELLPRVLANRVWQAMLESVAADHAARMQAMENATGNANEMIAKLTLQYNRSRQAAITKELMEVVSGAEALK